MLVRSGAEISFIFKVLQIAGFVTSGDLSLWRITERLGM